MSKIPKANPRGGRQMYVPGASPEAQNANLRTVVDELRAHTSQLKKDLEAERSNIKDLRREKQTEVKSTRDQEQQKASLSLSELRAKLNHEKQRELATLRESLTKQHDQAINRLLKQKQELLARTQSDSQRDREMHYLKVKQQVWVEAKEEVKRTFEMDKGKLLAEIDELRRGKKKLEEELNDAVTGDRQRAIDLRKQWGEHQREMEQLQKDARRDIQRLMEELKSKDYSISELEKELGYKSGYTKRLQGEKDSLGNLLNLSKMAESWDHRSSSTHESSFGSSSGLQFGMADGADEDEKKFNKKISDLKGMLRKLEERNKQLVEDKADLERKIRNSTEARNTTPLIEKNKRLLRKIKDLEQLKKKLDERNKALSEENQKLRSLKENMRCRLERENQSLRRVLSKERQQTQQEASNSSRTGDDPVADKEEELKKLRVEVQEQFLEIVELKQAALEQDRLPKVQDQSPTLLNVPNFRPRSSSLTPYGYDDDVGVRSRSGSFGTPIPSPLALSDYEDSLDEVSVDEMMDGLATKQLVDAKQMEKLLQQNKELDDRCTKLQWQLQDSKDQSELLEFRILELEEEEENFSSTPTPQSTAENNQRVLSLEGLVLEKDSLIQYLQQEVDSQRECVQQMEDTHEQRVADLERTEAHLNTRIHELEDQLAHLQEDIHLGLAERNRERVELEAEISSLQETTEGLQSDQAQVADRLKSAEECRQSWLEEEEKLQKKLKKKELTETSYKKQIEKLKSELLASQEMTSLEGLVAPHASNNTNGNNNSGNMEESQDISLLQQKIKELELVKESLEAKLKDVEELVLNSDFASEETLREKIAELEQSNKLLNRQLKQAQASDVDKKDNVERAAAEARHTEKEFQGRIKELQQSEQNLLDRVAQLETQDNTWKSQVDSLQDRIQDLEGLRLELKGKLEQAEEHIEELQVAEKFARDELSASHGASSILGESLGLMGEFGELGALPEEEYSDYEEDDVEDTAPQPGGESASQDPGLQDNSHGVKEAESDMHSKIAELEKSEVELMEKVQSLEQVNLELTDLCQDLQTQATEFADENETLKEKLLNLEELQLQVAETSKDLDEREENELLKIKVEELQSEIELLKQRIDDGYRDRNESDALQKEQELSEELEVVKEENLELLDRLESEHTKLQEMKRECEILKTQHQDVDNSHINNTIGSDLSPKELQQDLERCRSEKAQLEEHFQTEIKELKSLLDELKATKEALEQQLKSSEDEMVRLEEVSAELHTGLECRIKELEEEKEELQSHLEALEENSHSPGSEVRSEEQKELEEESQILLSRVTDSEEQCQKLKEQVEVLEKRLQDGRSNLTLARKDSMRKSLECDDSARELADLKKRLKELEDVESDFFDQAEILSKMEKEQEDLKKRLQGLHKTEEEIIEQSSLLELKNEELEEIEELNKELKIDLEESEQKIAEQSNLLLEINKEVEELRDNTKLLEAAKEDLQEKLNVEVKLLEESKGELLNIKKELSIATDEICQQKEQLEKKEVRYREMEDILNQMEKGEAEKLKVADNMEQETSVGLLEQRIEALTQQEREYVLKIEGLEERQVAYEGTIAQADIIVSEVQQKLSEQNELLAAIELELQETIDQLESQKQIVRELSDQLQQQLEDTSHELDKKNKLLEIGEKELKDLKDSLKECVVECQVKEETLHKLRETEVNLTLKVESLELSKQLETEDTVTPVIEAKVMASQESTVEATSSADGVDFLGKKIPDQDLQERIKELEDRQSAFEGTLAQADIVLEETNQKLCEKSEVCDMQEREMVGLRDSVVVLQEDNVKLQSHLEAADDELEKKDHSLKESCSEVDNLKEQLQTLNEKMTSSEMTCNQPEKMKNFESDNKKAGFEEDSFREKSVESLTKKVSELTVERDELEWKVKALEERQEAFQETLAHADVIMTERESGFLERIDELESSQSNLQERLQAVNASKSLVRTSQSSDEDDDVQEFSVFTPNAKLGDLENFEKRAGEEKSDLEKRIQELQLEVEELRVSEKGLLKMIEEYKILENSLRVSNDEMKEELNLKKDEIKQLEISLEDGGPDNNLQAQLEELKSGVLTHDDTNLKLMEEINTLKDTITDLQDQLLRSPNQQISFDGFVTPKAADVKTELTKPKIIISEDNSDIEREILFDQDSLQEQVTLLESKLCDVNSQLEKVTAARDSLQLDLQEKEVTVEKLEKANKYLQDDIDICSTQMEELEQQLSQSSKEDSRVTNSSPESESQSQPQSIKELKETVSDLRKKLSASEQEKVELQEQNVNLGKGRKDLDNSAHKLKMQELERSVATLQKELDSANSDRVKTTNRLTEIVQFNREIKKDMRDQEESGKILEEENHLMKREKEILNEKLLTFGVCGEDLLKERMKHEGGRVAVAEKETTAKKKVVGYQSAVCINKASQTGPLTYLPSEFLLTTVLIEEGFEMTLKEFLEALPVAQSPTDPILLKEGKNYFVEFNKLYAGKDPTPRRALLRRLVRNIPRDKVTGIPRKDAASYPPIPGEESLQQEVRGSSESTGRLLDGASSATKTQMMDQFVAALWELPFEHLEINLDTASYWCPDDYDDDSLATVSECEHEEVHLEESARNGSVYADAPPLPQATPPATRKRSGSISSDSLAGDFNSLQLGYRRVIRDDSLELETEDEDDGGTLTPTLSTSSFSWRSETNLSSPGEVHSGLLESSKQGRPDTYSRSSESPSTRLPMSLQKSTPSRTDTYGDEMPLSLPRTAPPNRTARNMDIPDSQFERSTPHDYSDKPDAHLNSHLNRSSSYQPQTISHSRPDLNLRSRSELPSSTPWTTDQGSPDAFLRNSDGPSTFTSMSPSERTNRSLESPPPPLPEVSPPNRAYRRIESPPTLPGASPPKRVNGSHESSNTLPGTSPQNRTPGSLESSPTLPGTSPQNRTHGRLQSSLTLLGTSPQNRTQGSLEPFNALPGTSQPNRVGSESPPTLPDTSPPRKRENYPGSPDGLPPPLPGTAPPKVLATYPGSPGQTPGDSYSQSNDLDEIHDLPPPLPKTIPPKKPNTPEEFPISTNQQKRESAAFGERFENHNIIPYQNGQIVSAVTVDLASDSSSTDTINDQENVAGIPSGSMGKESNPSWDGRDLSSKSSIVRLPSSFDSGMDTVSSITEQEVEAITAASVFAGPDHAMRLPKTPGLQDVAGSVLAKPATPMWLKQMMDWQTAEKAKEETDIGRMKTSIETMEKQLQEKEDVVKELKQNEDNLKKKLRDYGDLRPLTIQLQTKEIDIQDKERQVALLKSEVKQKEREVNALQSKLEASQDRLKEKEELLKAKDEEETRIKEEMETKEKQLASKEEELQKTSEKIKNLETMRAHQQTPTDHTDSAKSPDSRAPDSRSGDWKSHDAMSDDTKPDISHHASRSGDPRSHDVSQQELHLASALNVLTRENEELRGRIQRYATIEARWDEMHQQLSDSRHSNRDRDALERKLQMAEDMLREKTSEELRLAEDNSALEERLKHLENERRKRDGIEEDYRNIKDQFDNMEHKKNEAEISVAPLQAKVSYLLQKCKEREAIIQKMAAELEQFRPDRTEQLLSEVSDLTAIVNLPSEEFNDPLPVSSRSRTTRGSRSRHPQNDRADISKQQRKLDKISKSLNDIRSVDESDDDELGRLGAARGRSTLDLISGSLDGDSELDVGGISLGELMRRTAGSRSRSHLTPTRRVEEDGELDLLRSVLDASPSKLRSTSSKPGRDNRASSRTNRRTPSFETPLRHNSLSHHIPVTSREGGLADLSYRGSPTVSEQDLADPLRPLPMSTHAALASSQQHTASELPHFTSQSGDVNTFIASPVDGIYQMYSSPTQLHSEPSASLSNPPVPADMTRTTNDPSQSFGRPLNNYHGGVTPGGQLMTNTNRFNGQFHGQPENGRNSRQNSSANGVLPVNGATNVTMQEGPNGRGPFGLIEGSHSNRDPQIPVGGMGEVLSPFVNQQISPSIVSGSSVRAPSVISAPVPSENSLVRASSSLGGTNGFPNNSHGIDSRSRGTNNLLETTLPPQGQVPSSHVTSMGPAMSNSAQRVGTAAIHHGITTHHGHPVSLVNSTGVQSAPVAQSGNQTTLQTSVMSNALHSENGSQPLSNTTLPSNINNRSSLVNPGMSPSSAHQKSNAQEIYKSRNTIQMQPGVGASGLNPRVASHPMSASANTPQGYIGASFYDGNSTTVTHPGYQAAGIASATFASTTPQHGLVQSPQNQPPQNQPGGLQSSTQLHIPNSSLTLPKTQNNGFLNLASSPTSGGQLMSASSNRTSMPGSSNIPASWLPIQSASPQQPPSLVPTAFSSHHGPLGSNGTASPQPHNASVGLRNGTRGVDEPDRSRRIPHDQKAKTHNHGDHQLSSHGALRQPHTTGMPQPPRSLIVSKVIGRHGAVLTWHPPNLDDLGRSNGLEIVGYKIFVNRQQKQLVTNAHLTKALVDGINLRTVQTFGIQTVSSTGQSSAIVETEFEDPGMLSSSWSDSAMTESSVGHGTVTSQGSSVVSEDLQERLFMAVYNYNPVEHSPNHYPTYEVAFNEGDIVTVFGSIRSDGFYQGKVRGRRGLVPSNFIEEIAMSGSHGRKKHSNSKPQKNGDSHRHREGDRRGSKEAARTSTKTSGRTREDQKRHGSASRV